MRYFECEVIGCSEKIEKTAKIRLKDYDYDSPICALNKYVYKNVRSDVSFFIYREEGANSKAIAMFNEEKISEAVAFSEVAGMIGEVAEVRLAKTEPVEVSIQYFVECVAEAKRRGYVYGIATMYLDDTNEFVYYDLVNGYGKEENSRFLLEERIVPKRKKLTNCMLDETVVNEINNIKKHAKLATLDCNMVHYVISGKGSEATADIAETIVQNLIDAGRIKSRRIDIVRELESGMFKSGSFENLVKGAYGGCVVVDMKEKFGTNPVDYAQACKYIKKVVNKYKNNCLFIFTYDINEPGFSYNLLGQIKDQMLLVKLKEATGTRKDAVKYLKNIILNSEYSEYAELAGEFMEDFRGNKFSQTDVLTAYEKFIPWCMKRNFSDCGYNMDEDLLLDYEVDGMSPQEKLDNLIGLGNVKEHIGRIIASDLVEQERKLRSDYVSSKSMHMIFAGNPGSAKTTVAKLFAGIAKENGILSSGSFLERGGNDYGLFGSGEYDLREDFEAAMGGVLFIDEAYAMSPGTITILLQEMEKRRDDVIVILAGYGDEMESFLNVNDGLKSRIPHWVDFPDYQADELLAIFKYMAEEKGFKVSKKACDEAYFIIDNERFLENFGNGRYVRNLIEKAIQNQSLRLINKYEETSKIPKRELYVLKPEDFYSEDDKKLRRKPGDAKKDLEAMIGLTSAKAVIRKAVASFKMKKVCTEKGISKDKPSMHMVFTGNPGTAKTTTARLVAEILRDEKVLPSKKFVEVGRADLVGAVVGETAKLVKHRFRQARGGVLFIDEAYSLNDGVKGSFGEEAINTIVQEMENHREDTVVIFAGYPKEMKAFLTSNPGLASRIAFNIEFDDYSTDELCDIAKHMLKQKKYKITEEALAKLKANCEKARVNSDFGNGRYVRKLIEEAEMNIATRLSDLKVEDITDELLTTIEACDIEEYKDKSKDNKAKRIGF